MFCGVKWTTKVVKFLTSMFICTFNLYKEIFPVGLITIDNVSRFTLYFKGSTIIFATPQYGLRFRQCHKGFNLKRNIRKVYAQT